MISQPIFEGKLAYGLTGNWQIKGADDYRSLHDGDECEVMVDGKWRPCAFIHDSDCGLISISIGFTVRIGMPARISR